MSAEDKPAVRSFVRREGRITKAQSRALSELWPRYGVDLDGGVLNFENVFGNRHPVVMEIGFGNGESLCEMAVAQPECNFLGIEVYRPGVGSLLLKLKAKELTNVRLIMEDAAVVLRDAVPPGTLSKVLIFFPDPWPKKRHHKRRLLQRPFLDTMIQRLRPNGTIHVATDWEEYAQEVLQLLTDESRLRNTEDGGGFATRPAYRSATKFEKRGTARGHGVWDLIFERVD